MYYPGQKKRPLRLCIKSEHCSYHAISAWSAWSGDWHGGAASRDFAHHCTPKRNQAWFFDIPWLEQCSDFMHNLSGRFFLSRVVALQCRSCTQLLQLSSWPCTGTENESSGFGGNSIRQRAATFSLPDSVSKRAVVDKPSSLREESVKRYVHDLSEEFAHPKINVLHLPQHFSQLEARNTDDDNAKQQKRKIEYSSIRSLSHVHQFRTPCSNRRRKGQFSTRPRGTIAVLAQTNAIFSLHNRAAGRGPYISYGRNLWTCLNRPEFLLTLTTGRYVLVCSCCFFHSFTPASRHVAEEWGLEVKQVWLTNWNRRGCRSS